MKNKLFYSVFPVVLGSIVAAFVGLPLCRAFDPTGLAIAATLALGFLILVVARRARDSEGDFEHKATNAADLSRSQTKPGSRGFLISMATVCYALAVLAWATRYRLQHGRWAWLIDLFYEGVGDHGPAVFFAVAGTMLLVD